MRCSSEVQFIKYEVSMNGNSKPESNLGADGALLNSGLNSGNRR